MIRCGHPVEVTCSFQPVASPTVCFGRFLPALPPVVLASRRSDESTGRRRLTRWPCLVADADDARSIGRVRLESKVCGRASLGIMTLDEYNTNSQTWSVRACKTSLSLGELQYLLCQTICRVWKTLHIWEPPSTIGYRNILRPHLGPKQLLGVHNLTDRGSSIVSLVRGRARGCLCLPQLNRIRI